MKVLDGRNPYKIPQVIEIEEPKVLKSYLASVEDEDRKLMAIELDGMVVTAASGPVMSEYEYILCSEHKTLRGFDNWLMRYYPMAYQS